LGLLAVDIIAHGVVMSADSQRVEIRGGAVYPMPGSRRRNAIVVREGGGFVGLIGFAGTEEVEGIHTREWLAGFSALWPHDDLGAFCRRLADTLRAFGNKMA
jgi:hypothetical protein